MDVWPACKILEHKLKDILAQDYLSIFGRPAWYVLHTHTKDSKHEMERVLRHFMSTTSVWKSYLNPSPGIIALILWRISAPIHQAQNNPLLTEMLFICDGASEEFKTVNIVQTQEPVMAALARSVWESVGWETIFEEFRFGSKWFPSYLDISIPGQLFVLVALDGIKSKLDKAFYPTFSVVFPVEVNQFLCQLLSKKVLDALATQTTWPTMKNVPNLSKAFLNKIMRVISFFDFKRSEGVTGEFLLDLFNRAVGSFHHGHVDLPMACLPAHLNGNDDILEYKLTPACMSYMTIAFVCLKNPMDMARYVEEAEEVIASHTDGLMPELVVVLDFGCTNGREEPMIERAQRKNIGILALRGMNHYAFENSCNKNIGSAAEYFNSSIYQCKHT